jgi:WD40 repeat protein
VPSPDGKYLYYTQRQGFLNKVYNVTFPLSQIVRRNRATGEEDVMTYAPGSAFRPVLSPDGSHLVYGTRYETETGLKIMDLRTGEQRWLKYPVQRDDQESLFTRDFLPGYSFTPDGKEVVISYGGKIHRVNVATGQDQLVPFTVKVSQPLGPWLNFPARVEDGPVKLRIIQGAVQSPDGKQVAFSAATHLYVMDIPGRSPRRLTQGREREYQPAWSPDGEWIAYVTWSSAGGQIWKIRSQGNSAPVQLTKLPAYYRDVAWTPDGTRIVALRAPRQWQLEKSSEWGSLGGTIDLISVQAEGGDSSIISSAGGAGFPHFVTSQKDRVYLYGKQGLISMRLDGTDRRTHLKIVRKAQVPRPGTEEVEAAEEARISPVVRWFFVL